MNWIFLMGKKFLFMIRAEKLDLHNGSWVEKKHNLKNLGKKIFFNKNIALEKLREK
jgi:hypothetical protein